MESKLKNIFFVRHGEYLNNVEKKMNHDPLLKISLDEVGINQAKLVGEKFKKIIFDRVYCSQFLRCFETASYISNIKPIVDSRLNEMKIGSDKLTYGEHRVLVRNQIYKNEVLDSDESIYKKIEDLKIFILEVKNLGFENVLVTSHKDILRLIKIINEDLTLDKFYDMDPKNCEVYKVEFK